LLDNRIVKEQPGKVVPLTFFVPRLRIIAAALSLTLLCGTTPRAQTTAAPSVAPPSAAPAIREVTDEIGRTIRIPQPVRRIVSLAPSLTETLYTLGLQERLVGDTDYCDYPPDAQKKPKVGGVINPSLEAIAALHPDLVLVTKTLNRLDTVTALADLGIPSYATDPHTVADIISSTQRLAAVLGAPDAADAAIKDADRRLTETQERLAPYPQRRVLFIVWTDPLISVGKDTFIADALLHAGAVSIVDSRQNWPQVSLEDVARQQPEFLVFAESHQNAAPLDLQSFSIQPGWRMLDAVRDRHYALVSDAVNRPALGIVSAIEDLAKQLHPEAFIEKPDEGSGDKANRPIAEPPSSSSLVFLRSPLNLEVQAEHFLPAPECVCAL
jgi:iron complex transport system substrate-binding protein